MFGSFDFSLITESEITIAFVGYTIVFIVLILLYLFFRFMPFLLNINIKKKVQTSNSTKKSEAKEIEVSGEVNAAISMAIYMYVNELHDEESAILTMQKVSKTYSPWSSKIYSVMNFRKN